MQPVTFPGALPLIVSLRFSKAKVKSPLGQSGTEENKQGSVEVVVVVVVAVVVVVVVVVVLVGWRRRPSNASLTF